MRTPAMRKKELTHIGDYCRRFLEINIVESDDYASRILFKEFVGPKISKHAQVVKVSKGTVYVQVKTAVVRNELVLMKKKILKAMNEGLSVAGCGKADRSKELKNMVLVQE